MNDLDRWIYLDDEEPPSMRPLLDALRDRDPPRPRPEDKARVIADLFATFDARLSRLSEQREEEARASAAPDPVVAPEETTPIESLLDFEDWATLSIRFLAAPEDEQSEALTRRSLTPEAWSAIDEGYLRLLSEDLEAGRAERPARYAARCDEEMARRAEAEGAEEGSDAGEEDEDEEAAPTPAMPRPKNKLQETAEALDIPAAMREASFGLPFKEAPEELVALKRATPKTLRGEVMPSGVKGTLPLGDNRIHKLVAALAPGWEAAAGVVTLPTLTVQHYVKLRAELLLRPEVSAEILARYGVANEAARRALDAHWREQMTQKPALRAEYETLVANFAGWLRAW